jgi:starvation-inducible DNA-binding protein
MELHNTKIDIDKGLREQVIGILNKRLADAVDLKSQAKQAHWNVKGPNFIALHELFDQVSTEMDTHDAGRHRDGHGSFGGPELEFERVSA